MNTKQIPSFPDFYVTDTGNVLNKRGQQLSPYNHLSYKAISLKDHTGRRKGTSVHRLVAEAFLGPIPKGHWVRHKNGVKSDNRVENLEVGLPIKNIEHARDTLKRSYEVGRRLLDKETIEAIRLLAQNGYSQHALSRIFLVSQPAISNLLNGKTWKTETTTTSPKSSTPTTIPLKTTSPSTPTTSQSRSTT